MERVELCFHSRFDIKGSVIGTNEIMEIAGQSGIVGVTDYASILGWPELLREKNWKAKDAKLILGCEIPVEFKNGTHMVTFLAKNDLGRQSLCKLVMESELHHKKKNVITITDEMLLNPEYRDGILLGGYEELICAIEDDAEDDILEILALDYDFFLLDVYDTGHEEAHKKMIRLGESMGKPVVATCRPYYINVEDKETYEILCWNRNEKEVISDRHFLSTAEMIEKLSIVSKEKAKEIVITNSNLVAAMCEEVDFCGKKQYPVLANQGERLKKICYDKLVQLYGSMNQIPEKIYSNMNQIPENYRNRVEWELNAIHKTEMEFVFLELRELLEKMNLKPWNISNRGVWGNSFVAYLCELTEINPFDYDLSPYITFGLHGDKPIDIDINLPYNRKSEAIEIAAHLEGLDTVMKAGVYGTLGEKRAYNYICRFEEKRHIHYSDDEKEKICVKLRDVFHTRGVYPGGLIFIPKKTDIPRQIPLGKVYGDEYSSYFSYYDLENSFYKQDLLGHDVPMLLNKMSEKTEVSLDSISFEDDSIMKLFQESEDGSFGCRRLYEFENEYGIEILKITKPTCFMDLAKVLAFMHGTNVWENNMKILISEGIITIREAFATRDDLFDYLTRSDVSDEMAFRITETVRKGQVASGRASLFWENAVSEMKNCNVPDWFISSCEKIRYMFSRAHTISYARMIWREGFFKVYYPEIFSEIMSEYK
ncbi:MAG: hypothetical protein PUE95_04215 [Lachnospiraceae bacterium]|nr:hypothetical protein [Lachnospiraceae bacterium]